MNSEISLSIIKSKQYRSNKVSKKENTKQTEFEPILFEIIEGSIESARREMEIQVERTARSSIFRFLVGAVGKWNYKLHLV